MKYLITVLRHEAGEKESYWQSFEYCSDREDETVANALNCLNNCEQLRDVQGDPARKIEWECSCLQKKCGACAMVINGRPALACDVTLSRFTDGKIVLSPLKKFPVVCDLTVDRSIMYENLKTMKLWLNTEARLSDDEQKTAYESSQCIQCGCCLEVCPNFRPKGSFYGMNAIGITNRLLTEMDLDDAGEIMKEYERHTFAGCGKSLACKNVCPKGIDTEKLMVNANAIAIWKRKKRG